MRFLLAVPLLVTLSFGAHAQELCSEVLRYAARNHTLEAQQNTVGRYMYDQYCEKKHAKSGIATDGTAAFPIEGIPVKFTGAASGNQDKIKNLCRSVGDLLETGSESIRVSNLASVPAIAAWENCMQFAQNGRLRVRPFVTQTRVILNVEKIGADPVTVKSLIVGKNLKCEADQGDLEVKVESIDKPSSFKPKILNTSDSWQLICARQSEAVGADEVFPATEVGLTTSKGPFIFQVPKDTQFGVSSAAEIRAEVEKVKQDLHAEHAALKARLTKQLSRIQNEAPNHGGVITNPASPKGAGYDPTQSPGRCPTGAFVVGIQPLAGGSGINFQCGKLPALVLE